MINGNDDYDRRRSGNGQPRDGGPLHTRRGEGHDEEEDPRILAARRLFRSAPRYRVQFEADGTVTSLVSRVGVDPNSDPDTAILAMLLAA